MGPFPPSQFRQKVQSNFSLLQLLFASFTWRLINWCGLVILVLRFEGIVYPVASRWGWYEDGWLATGISGLDNVAYLDFAGSGLVHLLGGTAAFFGAFFCGPRQGRFDMDSSNTLPGHSTPVSRFVVVCIIKISKTVMN